MRMRRRLGPPAAVSLCLLALPALGGIGQWTNGGPYGGGVTSLAIDPLHPSVLYAGTTSVGVFRSTDSGSSWKAGGEGLGYGAVLALAIDPQDPATLFAGMESGLFRSSDSGTTWARSDLGIPDARVAAIAFDPRTSSTVYAMAGGLYKSTDGGATWSVTLATYHEALAVDPAVPTTIYVGGEDISRSTDAGATWTTTTGLPTVYAILVDPFDGAKVYAGSYRSTDAGASWLPMPSLAGLSVYSYAADPFRPGSLFAAVDDGVLRSTDGGTSWSAASGPAYPTALGADPLRHGRVYAGSWDRGVHRSTDGGVSWIESNDGLLAMGVNAVGVDPRDSSILYAAVQGAQVFKSTDGGAHWDNVLYEPQAWSAFSVAVDPGDDAVVYASLDDGLRRSSDGGVTWSRVDIPGCWGNRLVVDPWMTSRLFEDFYCNGGQWSSWGFRRSTDRGITWDSGKVWEDAPIAISPFMPDTVMIGRWRSTDAGNTWTQVANFAPISYAADPSTPGVLYSHGGDAGAHQRAGLRRSTDFGLTWSSPSLQDLATTLMSLAVDPTAPATLYARTPSRALRSTDAGGTWTDFNAGLPAQVAYSNRPPDLQADATGRVHAPSDTGGVWQYSPARRSGFYPLAPCRVLDTRLAEGPLGGPSIASSASRTFALAGTCGIPADAASVSVNVTAVPSGTGELAITIPGIPGGGAETLPLRAGRTRAKNAIVALNPDGSASIAARNASDGALDFVLDVNGYFR